MNVPDPEVDARRVRDHARKAMNIILFTKPEGMTLAHLRRLLRDAFLEETDDQKRAVASISEHQLIKAIIETNDRLRSEGLWIQLANGYARMSTIPVADHSPRLAEMLREVDAADARLSEGALEVLAAIAYKEPVSAGELETFFDADKRSQLEKLLELGLVARVRAKEGQGYRYVTTPGFLSHFGMETRADLTGVFQQLEQRAQSAIAAARATA